MTPDEVTTSRLLSSMRKTVAPAKWSPGLNAQLLPCHVTHASPGYRLLIFALFPDQRVFADVLVDVTGVLAIDAVWVGAAMIVGA